MKYSKSIPQHYDSIPPKREHSSWSIESHATAVPSSTRHSRHSAAIVVLHRFLLDGGEHVRALLADLYEDRRVGRWNDEWTSVPEDFLAFMAAESSPPK